MKTSLNQIISILETITTNHKQIKGFEFNDVADWAGNTDNLYPFVLCDVQPSNFSTKIVSLTISVMVMDIIKKDTSNQNEVLSDTLQILDDLIAELHNDSYVSQFIIKDDIQARPFNDSQGDEVGGWVANLTFDISSPYNRCIVPTN